MNLSAPSVTERVRKLEVEGIIQGYTISINRASLGLPLSALVEITVKNGDYQAFQKLIERQENVEFCYRIAGRACYVVKINMSSLQEVEHFINALSPVASTVSHVIFSEVTVDQSVKNLSLHQYE